MIHQFALFDDTVTFGKNLETVKHIVIHDNEICNRILKILRLFVGDSLTIFNRSYVFNGTISEIYKKEIILKIDNFSKINYLTPELNIAIGLLKKDDFEQALVNATILGATSIQPLITERIHRNWWSDKFMDRFESVMISAAEQSKNFALPVIRKPLEIQEWLKNVNHSSVLLCDPAGKPLSKVVAELFPANIDIFTVLIGPEGGFSPIEESFLDFNRVSLTPTILKAVDAVLVSGGIVRNLTFK